jgi:PilX N-terminal
LILVLIFALLLNIVASSILQSATLQARMAGNSHAYVESLQLAEGISRSMVNDPNNFSLVQEPGTLNCLVADEDVNCTSNTLREPGNVFGTQSSHYRAVVLRNFPRTLEGEVVEIDPGGNVDLVPFDVALYELEVSVTGTGDIASTARISTGVALPLDGTEHWVTYQRELGSDAL